MNSGFYDIRKFEILPFYFSGYTNSVSCNATITFLLDVIFDIHINWGKALEALETQDCSSLKLRITSQ